MLILSLEQVKAGMKLAAPVFNPEHPDQDLLKGGYVLEEPVLQRLKEIGVPYIYVDYPALADLDRHLAPYLSPARQRIYCQIKETITAARKHTRPAVSYIDYYSATREMVCTLLAQGQHPVYLDQMAHLGIDAIGHAAAVAHLSLLLGLKLQRYLIDQRNRLPVHHAKEVVNLGVGGMLHDMGKLKLPEPLQNHSTVDAPEDATQRALWETHAQLGFQLIHNGVEASAASAVLHHHQHYDGSGFPPVYLDDDTLACPAGQQIYIFGRIVFAADLYDRLTRPSSAKARRSNLELLHLLRRQYSTWIDPLVMQALEQICPPFPPGSCVDLSDGTAGVVTRFNPANPYQTVVQRLAEDGWTMQGEDLDLAQEDAPQIIRVGGVAVAGLLPEEQATF